MTHVQSTISITKGQMTGSSRWVVMSQAMWVHDAQAQYAAESFKIKLTKETTTFQTLVAFTVSLFQLIVGYASAYTAPALVSMDHESSTIHPTVQEKSWIGSLMPLSALVGGLIGGVLIEYFGRKKIIMASAFPFAAAFILIGSAANVAMILLGRALAGLSVGIVTLAIPMYLCETLSPEIRGTLGILPSALGNLGILTCFTIGTFVDWRFLAYVGAALNVPPLLLMFFIPESPLWYINNGYHDKAENALVKLRGKHINMAKELDLLHKTSMISQLQMTTKMTDIFKKATLWPLSISLGLMFFQQFSGINAMIFYTVDIFQEAGSTINSNLASIIVGLVNLSSTIAAAFLIDLLGRKILLYISSSVMAVTLGSLGIYFYAKNDLKADLTKIGWIPLLIFVLFVLGFSIGAGPIPWLMMGEILPAKMRGVAASLATAFNWTCTFIVTKTFIDLTLALGSQGAFWFFGIVCVGFLIFTTIFVPETRRKSLQEIERKFNKEYRRETARRTDGLRRVSST